MDNSSERTIVPSESSETTDSYQSYRISTRSNLRTQSLNQASTSCREHFESNYSHYNLHGSRFSLIFSISLFYTLIFSLSIPVGATITCPSVCSEYPCKFGDVDCSKGGLEEIPDLPKETKLIVLKYHTFKSTILRRSDMNKYSEMPKLTSLKINNCNLKTIESNAFDSLRTLDMLDLSNNKLMSIEPLAFTGLQTNNLDLSNNYNLELSPDSFKGLKVSKMSLKSCGINTIPKTLFESIKPGLSHLVLSNNSLTTLSQDLTNVINGLKILKLDNNKLSCDCELQWLAEFYKTKWTGERIVNNGVPMCSAPSRVQDKYIDHLDGEFFYCNGPLLQSIEVDFITPEHGELKCAARGSSKMKLHWTFPTHPDSYVQPSTTNSEEFNTATILFNRKFNSEQQHHFRCIADDSKGTAAANVKINWPQAKHLTTEIRPPLTVDIGDKSRSFGGQSYEERQPGDGKTSSPLSNPDDRNRGSTSNNFLYVRRFSLLEMIGAVVGTFTLTLIFFGIVCRCFFCSGIQLKKRHHNSGCTDVVMGSHGTHSSHGGVGGGCGSHKKTTYSTYEPTSYSDCQYDTPNYPFSPPHLPPPPQLPSLPPPPPPTSGPYLDFRTQRKLLYNHV